MKGAQHVDLTDDWCRAADHTQEAHRSLLADAFVLVQHNNSTRLHHLKSYCMDDNMEAVFMTQVTTFCATTSFRACIRLCPLAALAHM